MPNIVSKVDDPILKDLDIYRYYENAWRYSAYSSPTSGDKTESEAADRDKLLERFNALTQDEKYAFLSLYIKFNVCTSNEDNPFKYRCMFKDIKSAFEAFMDNKSYNEINKYRRYISSASARWDNATELSLIANYKSSYNSNPTECMDAIPW